MKGYYTRQIIVFLIKESDGLDPKFVKLEEILVIGNCLITFIVDECKVLYFDDHYHAYAIELTPNIKCRHVV